MPLQTEKEKKAKGSMHITCKTPIEYLLSSDVLEINPMMALNPLTLSNYTNFSC